LTPPRRTAHGQGLVAGPDGQRFGAGRERVRERLEVRAGMVEAGAGHGHVFIDHVLTLSLKLRRQGLLEDLEVQPEQGQGHAQRDGVLDELVSALVGQLRDRHRTQLNALVGVAGFDRVAVKEHAGARAHQPQVSVHGVLIQAQEQVQPVPVAVDVLVADTDGEKYMSASNDRLIGVVRVQVKTAGDKHAGEDIAGGRDPLPGCAANAESKIKFRRTHKGSPVRSPIPCNGVRRSRLGG